MTSPDERLVMGGENVGESHSSLPKSKVAPVRGKAEVVKIEGDDGDDESDKENDVERDAKVAFAKQLLQEMHNKNADSDKGLPKKEQTEEEALMEELAKKPFSYFRNLKDMPDPVAQIYYKEIRRRRDEAETRIKSAENLLKDIKCEDRSLEEDRVEILGELLDKVCQIFDVIEEHEERRIPFGHRIVLETALLMRFHEVINMIFKIVGEFDRLKDDRIGVNDERDQLRYEIRYCDALLTEVHERYLKSYLEMEW